MDNEDTKQELEAKIDALILEVGGLSNAAVTDLLEAMCQRYQDYPPDDLAGA